MYYDINFLLTDENTNGLKWFSGIECTLPEKAGFAIVFDTNSNKWVYQSNAPKDWNSYLVKVGRLKLSEYQKINDSGEIVSKTREELLSDGVITQEQYNESEINRLKAQLYEFDIKSIRGLRELLQNENPRLKEIEVEAEKARAKIRELS